MQRGLILTAGTARGNVALGQRAERAGFDAVLSVEFFNQHAFAVLGAIAATTERIRIGSGIANAFTRAPLVHATAAMDLDELSGGRMVLGLGSGTRRMNQDWWGVPFAKPAARMRELVQVIRAAFGAANGFGFRFQGQFWDLKIPVYTRPGARADLPIWVAAVNAPMIRSAGAAADGLVGRLVPYVMTAINRDRAQAVQDAKRQIGFYYTVKVYHTILRFHDLPGVAEACRKALATFDVPAMAAAIPDALVDEIAIACTPDEAHDRLEQWRDLCDEVLFYAPTVGVPPERVRDNNQAILDVFGSSPG
jgi:alkanesulfonate monooxygenase SsuD/methylene tetrahydromethanopterin reductase-like flavin-dependent oxidoreductase (luciferase family)